MVCKLWIRKAWLKQAKEWYRLEIEGKKSDVRKWKATGSDINKTMEKNGGEDVQRFDPRRALCWKLYTDPTSPTFGLISKSAILAGFSEPYSNDVGTTPWFKVRVMEMGMLDKALTGLDEMLALPTLVEKVVGKGDNAELVVVTDPQLVKIKQDTQKFVVSRRGKDSGWAERNEVTGANGAPFSLASLFDGAEEKEEEQTP